MTDKPVLRKLAAILYADVAEYSRLTEADEVGTHRQLSARLDLIAQQIAGSGGQVVHYAGDAVLASFESVVDATHCAVDVQKALQALGAELAEDRRLLFRIGINLGEVIVDRNDIYGDGVNVAARLEQLCDPGGVLVSEPVYEQLRGRFELALDYTGEHKVKNISRSVRSYRVRIDGTAPRRRRRPLPALRRTILPAAALVLIVAAAVWQLWPAPPPELIRAGIAVLPFENVSGEESMGRIADGLTEDIITDLSHFADLDVIVRNSTATYKGRPVDVREIGKAFNVGYVLEGSLQRQGERIRITAQLIDATTGTHVWSNRWDRQIGDVFAVQSEVAEQVAAKLGGAFGFGTVTATEVRRAKRRAPADLGAYEHYLLAVEAKGLRSPQSGLEHAEKAVALDPDFARAYTARGWLRYFTIVVGENWARTIDLVGDDFRRAVVLDPADAEARIALGQYLAEKGRLAESEAEFRRALDQSPANAHVLALVASNLPYFGKPEEAVTLAERALRLDPNMPLATRGALKTPFFFARRFERAVEVLNSVPEPSRSGFARLVLAASYTILGRAEEAAAARATFVAKHGEPSAEAWLNEGFVFARATEQELFVDAFHRLGLPVCAPSGQRAKLAKTLPGCT